MLFTILAGVPYLVANGMMYPVTIKDDEVKIAEADGEPYEGSGRYTLAEIHAKVGRNVTRKRTRRKKD